MATTSLVVGVSAGEQASVGEHKLHNASGQFIPDGSEQTRWGFPTVSAGQNGAALALEFGAALPPPTAALLMPLSGAPVLLPRALDSVAFGRHGIANTAQAAYPLIGDCAVFGSRTLAAPSPAPAASLALDMTALPAPGTAKSLALSFGGALPVMAGAGEQSSFGDAHLSVAYGLHPPGGDQAHTGGAVVYAGPSNALLTLEFGAALPPPTAALLMPLSGAPVLLAAVGEQASFGSAAVTNAALGLRPEGVRPQGIGSAVVHAGGSPAASLVLNMTAAYKPADAQSIQLAFGSDAKALRPQGWDAGAMGTAQVLLTAVSLYPTGIDSCVLPAPEVRTAWERLVVSGWQSGASGMASIRNAQQAAAPKGWDDGARGQPEIANYTRYLLAGGLPPRLAFGTAQVDNRTRYVTASGLAATQWGNALAAYGRRAVGTTGASAMALGTPWASFSPRELSPAGAVPPVIANHQVGGLRYLQAVGFNATQWGTRIIPEGTTLYPQGFAEDWGEALVWPRWQIAAPPGFLDGGSEENYRFGAAVVWNLTQYIEHRSPDDSELAPPPWSLWQSVTNRNFAPVTFGQDMSRLGYPQVDNRAVPVRPVGIAPESDPPGYMAGMVAYRIRSLPVDGMEPPYLSGWSAVYNDARVLDAQGVPSSAEFGTPGLLNTRRNFPYVTGGDQQIVGTAMVAPRIRELAFESRYTIGAPALPLPGVKLHTRYVEGAGGDLSSYGVPYLEVHWTLIVPRWTMQNYYGSPVLHNVTPELGTHGHNSEEYGDTQVRLQWRPLPVQGDSMQFFGRAVVADRKQKVNASGLQALSIGQHKAAYIGDPPRTTQYLYAAGFPDNKWIGEQVPYPAMNQQVVYVVNDNQATQFGRAEITANTVRVEPGYGGFLVGTPAASSKIRTLAVEPWKDPENFTDRATRASPFTIWARHDAPAQAQTNNQGHPWEDIDAWPNYFGVRPDTPFGFPVVASTIQRVAQDNSRDPPGYAVSQPALTMRKRALEIKGWMDERFGWHTMPAEQEVDEFEAPDSAACGRPGVISRYYGPQAVSAPGMAGAFGATRIELFNRTIDLMGWDSQALGSRLSNDTPYMWRGLRVGPPMPTIPNGFDAQKYGTTWVSFSVRGVDAEGFETFDCAYTLEQYEQRMRVLRGAGRDTPKPPSPPPPPRTAQAAGIGAAAAGVPDIWLHTRYIRPDGNSETYRKGAF